jgi:hypothetical protein
MQSLSQDCGGEDTHMLPVVDLWYIVYGVIGFVLGTLFFCILFWPRIRKLEREVSLAEETLTDLSSLLERLKSSGLKFSDFVRGENK